MWEETRIIHSNFRPQRLCEEAAAFTFFHDLAPVRVKSADFGFRFIIVASVQKCKFDAGFRKRLILARILKFISPEIRLIVFYNTKI